MEPSPTRPRGHALVRLTEDDRLILEWLDLVPGSTYEHLSEATGRSVDALRHRLPRLEATGHVHRELMRRAHRSTAFWYPSRDGRSSGAARQAAEAELVHNTPATVATVALLPHFIAADRRRCIYNGSSVAELIDTAILRLRLRESSSNPIGDICLGRLPDYLVHDGHCWTAIELRLASAPEDWTSRLSTYRRLGVSRVEVHTDQPLLTPILGRLSAQTDTPQVCVRLWTPTQLNQAT